VLYKEKDYEAECDFLEELFRRYHGRGIKNILDLGCGTGGHALPLARRGYKVHGIDLSVTMTAIAKDKANVQGLSERIWFETGNIQNVNLGKKFDAVICMFAVIGYQISNEELFAVLQNVRKHLKPKGLFICDFWYGPAVLKERPTERIKILNEKEDRIMRIARPEIDTQKNVVVVSYHLLRLRGIKLLEETRESHEMRYLFKPEIDFMLSQAGMQLVHFCPFGSPEQEAGEETWNVAAIAQAVSP
jgi:SAM-dependent methyltransferase